MSEAGRQGGREGREGREDRVGEWQVGREGDR